MSTKPNHRRGEGRKQDNGSTWEGEPNDGGEGIRNARRGWRRLRARAERRTGKTSSKFLGAPRVRPDGGASEAAEEHAADHSGRHCEERSDEAT